MREEALGSRHRPRVRPGGRTKPRGGRAARPRSLRSSLMRTRIAVSKRGEPFGPVSSVRVAPTGCAAAGRRGRRESPRRRAHGTYTETIGDRGACTSPDGVTRSVGAVGLRRGFCRRPPADRRCAWSGPAGVLASPGPAAWRGGFAAVVVAAGFGRLGAWPEATPCPGGVAFSRTGRWLALLPLRSSGRGLRSLAWPSGSWLVSPLA